MSFPKQAQTIEFAGSGSIFENNFSKKLLPSFSKGHKLEEGMNKEVPQGQHLVGTWHTPEQFVSEA